MGCIQNLTLTGLTVDQPMDAACFNPSDGFIYGVRGGRIFRCDPVSGNIISQTDYDPRLLGGCASVCYDSATNSIWAGGFNDPSANIAHGNAIPATFYDSPRRLYKITPGNPPAVAQIFDISANFPGVVNVGQFDDAQILPCGIRSLLAANGNIYAGIYSTKGGGMGNAQTWMVKFSPANVATQHTSFSTLIGGQMAWTPADLLWSADETFPRILSADMTAGFNSAVQTFPPNTTDTFFPIAIEYSSEQNVLFVTSQDVGSPGDGSWIYRVSLVPAEVLRFNLGRPNFNGIHIRRCPLGLNTGLLYAAGYGDNSIAVINPATNTATIKTGFDLPLDVVFTATKAFAVQQGAVPLKEIV